jgi:chromosome segregation ATPase
MRRAAWACERSHPPLREVQHFFALLRQQLGSSQQQQEQGEQRERDWEQQLRFQQEQHQELPRQFRAQQEQGEQRDHEWEKRLSSLQEQADTAQQERDDIAAALATALTQNDVLIQQARALGFGAAGV